MRPPLQVLLTTTESRSRVRLELALRLLLGVLLLFFFLMGIRGMGLALSGLGHSVIRPLFSEAENPFLGFAVGVLATAVVQSSSLSTSMIVALVAVPGAGLAVTSAIPIVMGANLGTTVTNSLVALGYVGRREFQRALAAATCHDFFNMLVIAVLLPLELATGVLAAMSGLVARLLQDIAIVDHLPNPIGAVTEAWVLPLKKALSLLVTSATAVDFTVLIVAIGLIYACLMLLTRIFMSGAASSLKTAATHNTDRHPAMSVAIGALLTSIAQSSSLTTSALVPLAAARLIRLRSVLALTLGANVGTTLTAMLAALAAPKETAEAAIQVAAAHLLFNLTGVSVLLASQRLQLIPLRLAEAVSRAASRSRRIAIGYIFCAFYAFPALVIFVARSFS